MKSITIAVRYSFGCAVTALIMVNAAPAHAGRVDRTAFYGPCHEWARRSSDLRAFLAANPATRTMSPDDRLQAYQERGRLEWRVLLDNIASLTGRPGADEGDSQTPQSPASRNMTPETLNNDGTAGLRASPGSPLPLMRRFVEALSEERVGNLSEALVLATDTVRDASSKWGASDSGLVLGYTIIAQIQAQKGSVASREAADVAAKTGLAIIAAHPERAVPLAYYRATLLDLRATIIAAGLVTDQPIEDPRTSAIRAEVEALRKASATVRRENGTLIWTPFFDIAAMLPGTQVLSDWGREHATSVLNPFATPGEQWEILAGILPSPKIQDFSRPEPSSAAQLKGIVVECSDASDDAAAAGDLATSTAAQRVVFGLLSERSLLLLIHDSERTGESLDIPAVDDASGVGALGRTLALAEGDAVNAARNVERAITPHTNVRGF